MQIIRSKAFTAERAWGSIAVANMNGITTRVHWTDKPYKWHINDGEEVFAVLDGTVDMHYREAGVERVVALFASRLKPVLSNFLLQRTACTRARASSTAAPLVDAGSNPTVFS